MDFDTTYQEANSHNERYRKVEAIKEKMKVQKMPPVPPSDKPKPKLVKVFCHATTTVLQKPTMATNLKRLLKTGARPNASMSRMS